MKVSDDYQLITTFFTLVVYHVEVYVKKGRRKVNLIMFIVLYANTISQRIVIEIR